MHTFLPEHDVVCYCPARQESALLGIDDAFQNLFGSVANSASNDFKRNITQTYGSELLHGLGLLGLWDESYNYGIPLFKIFSVV